MTLRLSDAITELRSRGLRVEMPRCAGNNTALFIPVRPGVVLAIGDSGDLLTYSEGPDQTLQGEFAVTVYEYDGQDFDRDDYITPKDYDQQTYLGEFSDVAELATVVLNTIATWPRRRLTIDQSVEQAKAEILRMFTEPVDTSRGEETITPAMIASFSDLHDYCDANTLGAMCDGDENVIFIDAQGEIGNTAGDDADNDRWMAFCNEVSDRLDAWIKAGGHAVAVR